MVPRDFEVSMVAVARATMRNKSLRVGRAPGMMTREGVAIEPGLAEFAFAPRHVLWHALHTAAVGRRRQALSQLPLHQGTREQGYQLS
jgi:hypothetical protein